MTIAPAHDAAVQRDEADRALLTSRTAGEPGSLSPVFGELERNGEMARSHKTLGTGLRPALLALLMLRVATRSLAQDAPVPGGGAAGSPPPVDVAWAKALGVEVEYDKPPKVIEVTRPAYPKTAFKKGIAGTVLVEFVIDRRGRVAHTRVLKSVRELDAAALKCLRAWRFEPAIKGGEPVATVAHAPIVFRIGVDGTGAESKEPPQ